MSKRLKVGVVGGGIGAAHIEAYQQLPDLYEVVAFCDIDTAKTDKAKEFGIADTTTSFAALLDRDLDIVDITTPPDLHFSQATQALESGRHVVLEKPFVSSLAEADALAETEKASGKRLSADLPVSLRQRHPPVPASPRQGLRRQDLRRHRRDPLAAHRRLLRRSVAGKVEDRTRRLARRPRHPQSRHAHLPARVR